METSAKDYVRAYGKLEQLADYRWKSLARFVYSTPFELAIAFVILSNAFALALLTMPDLSEDSKNLAIQLDQIALWIYSAELVIRILSYGRQPWMFFRQGWNIFDFLIIAAAPLFAGQTVVLRLLRLFRLIRIFRFLPEVRVLSTSIVKSMPPLLSMGALIALLLFIYGMAGHYLFGAQAPESWGSIGDSMKSLFILLTLENFPVYLEESLEISVLAIPYFLSYVFIIVFTVLNVLIGIVLNAMDEARTENRNRESHLEELDLLAVEVDEITSDGKVTKAEIEKLKSELSRLRKLSRQK